MIDRLNAALHGRYHLVRELGRGGMATVYLAEDLKHRRKVALKVLKPELAAVVGGERFLTEIETTANLTHPNILPLFDSGEADTFLYYVMPYMDGETLRDRLDREKQLPVAEAVRLAGEVAEALDHAHRQGVVHRDIKPANILLQDGRPLVSDFGIALAVSEAGGGRLTETGLSMGTPHYMSPEQAAGDRDVDPRTDVYSLGCVLFEMLTGEPPYGGGTAQAVLAKILTAAPDRPTRLRATIPRHVEAVVLKGMEKLPADRFQTTADFARSLGDPSFRHGEAGADGGSETRARRWKRISLAAGLAAAGLAGLTLLTATRPPLAPALPPTTTGVFAMPGGQELLDALWHVASFAPDGSSLVYVGPGPDAPQLWLKARASHTARPLTGTAGAQHPEVDPTGRWVAFTLGTELRKLALAGGPSVALASGVATDIGAIAWLDDGTLAFTRGGERNATEIWTVPMEGGAAARVHAPDVNETLLTLTPLPGAGLLFVNCGSTCSGEGVLYGWRRGMEEPREIARGVKGAWFLDSGHLVMVMGSSAGRSTVGSVFAAPFDPYALELGREPVPLFEGVQLDNGIMPDMEVGPSGQILVRLGSETSASHSFHWIDRRGQRTPVDPDFVYQTDAFPGWALSPDGSLLAFTQTTEGNSDIWVKQLDAGPVYRLTFDERPDYRPAWHPDGGSILFVSERRGGRHLYRRRANATGPVESVLDREFDVSQGSWSPDGQWLVFREGISRGRDIGVFRPGVDSAASPLLAVENYDEKAPAISPDGRWIVYESDESGQDEVYVRPFPNVDEGKWQVSVRGGREPLWAKSGREIFYVRGDQMLMAATVTTGPPYRVGERRELFDVSDILIPNQEHTAYDIHPDDQRFIFSIPVATEEMGQVYWILAQNWTSELLARLGNNGEGR